MMTLEQFSATGRDVDDLGVELPGLDLEGEPGRVYLYNGGPYIQKWIDDRHGVAPPNGPTWLLIIGRDQYVGDLVELEPHLYEWAKDEGFFDEANAPKVIVDETRSEAIQALEREFVGYLDQQGLAHRCAMELIHGDLTDDQRRYISDFIVRWDAAEAEEA